MKILQLIALTLGHVWILSMVLRASAVYRESMHFYMYLKHMEYPGKQRRFTVWRYTVPNLLTSPGLLLMNGRLSLKALPAEDIYYAVLQTVEGYGVPYEPEGDPEPTEVEKCLANEITPYNRQLSPDNAEEVIEEAIKVRRELGLELPPSDTKKLH